MAALTGYLSGRDVFTEVQHDLSPYHWTEVFKPEFQYIAPTERVVSAETFNGTNVSQFLIDNVLPLRRKAEYVKKKELRRELTGANSNLGPDGPEVGRYSDDFYHRIHLTPSQLRLGNLTSRQERTIELWNAFFTPVELEDVQSINADGLTIIPPVGVPYTMGGLEALIYTVLISNDGPPAIAATLRWVVDDQVVGSSDNDAPVTGNRVIPIPMTPDWATPMLETLEWKTDVIKTYSGLEQRARIRSKPRRGQTYAYSLKNDQASNLENLLWGWQNRLFAVPLWTESTLSHSFLSQGQTGIPVQTEGYSYTPGALMFITNGISYEMQEIDSVTTGVVNLKKGLDTSWGRPTVLAPVNLGRIAGDLSAKMKRETANFMQSTLSFLYEPVQTDPYIPVAVATDTYQSEEILLKEPNWINGSDVEFISEGRVMDYGLQGFSIAVRSGIPDIVQEYEWFLNGREQMKWFREFLGRREGKFNGFWMPTWNCDFTITDTVSEGATGFKAIENYYGLLVDGAAGRNHVMVELKNGTKIIREISSAGIEVDGVTLNVVTTTTMGTTFTPDEVKRCSIVGWYRLYNDLVTLRYEDRNFAHVKMSLVNVQP